MAVISLPHSYETGDLGIHSYINDWFEAFLSSYSTGALGTHSYTYNWSSTSGYSTYYYSNTVNLTPQANVVFNSFKISGDNVIANVTINAPTAVSRSGSNPGNWTASSCPTIKLHNVALNSDIVLYNTSLSITVAYNGSGTIVHKVTKDVTIPLSWFTDSTYWNINVSYYVACGTGNTYTTTSSDFLSPVHYNNKIEISAQSTVVKLNSFVISGDNVISNVAINAPATASRSGDECDDWTFIGKPTIKIHNVALNSDVILYDEQGTGTVPYNGSGAIDHQVTKDVTIPLTWFDEGNTTWNIQVSYYVECNTNSTFTATSSDFTVEIDRIDVKIRINGQLKTVEKMWTRINGTLYEVAELGARLDGVFKKSQ